MQMENIKYEHSSHKYKAAKKLEIWQNDLRFAGGTVVTSIGLNQTTSWANANHASIISCFNRKLAF